MNTRAACRRLSVAAVALALAAGAVVAQAQGTYPARPMRIVVGFLPASSNDLLARFIGAKLTERMGQQVIIDNRPGANGIIAAEHTSKATPDGHTLMLVSISHTMNAAINPKLPYDTIKSFSAVATLGSGPLVVATHPSFTATTIRDLIQLAKAKPKTLNFASAGVGGINHFGAVLFSRAAGVEMTHVPYRGGAPALTDVIGGQVQLMWGTMPLTLPQLRAGKVKALAVTSPKRSTQLPDVPAIGEAGAPGAEISAWWGLIVPAGVPAERVMRLNTDINRILSEPETAQKLAAEGAEPWMLSSAQFSRVVSSEVEKWTRVVREANIRPE